MTVVQYLRSRAGHLPLHLLPSMVTMLGMILSLVGVVLLPAITGFAFLGVGLICDAVDGRLARSLGAVTTWGGRLDFIVDIMVAAALLWRLLPVNYAAVFIGVLVPWWAYAGDHPGRARVSGRAALTAAALVARFSGLS